MHVPQLEAMSEQSSNPNTSTNTTSTEGKSKYRITFPNGGLESTVRWLTEAERQTEINAGNAVTLVK